jgi:hypothetical protein
MATSTTGLGVKVGLSIDVLPSPDADNIATESGKNLVFASQTSLPDAQDQLGMMMKTEFEAQTRSPKKTVIEASSSMSPVRKSNTQKSPSIEVKVPESIQVLSRRASGDTQNLSASLQKSKSPPCQPGNFTDGASR